MAPEGAPDAISVERSADGSADTAASPLRTAVTPVPGVGQHLGESPGNHPGLRLEDQAQVVGAYLWIERRSFEILGSWVAREASEEARLLFDVHSQQHAWHAELFYERLPVLDWVDREGLAVPPSDAVEVALAMLAGTEVTLLRLVGAGRFLLPRLIAGYSLHLERATAVADAPLMRALRLVLRDELEAWQATEALTQSLLANTKDSDSVSSHLTSLEEPFVGTGLGLVPWPSAGAQGDSGA